MNILAICSALNNTYLGFKINNEEIHKIIKSDENYHSLYLISEIKNILKEKNFSLSNLDAICVNCGPGSFTGIRVALTVAKVLAGELNLPLIELNTAEILLNEFEKEYLIMDARRDMFFVGTKEKIELIYKDKIPNNIKETEILCDKNSKKIYTNSTCFEEIDKELSKTMIKIAKHKYLNSNNKEDFNYLNVKANYIQTPPVF